jgi:hypothetical protein
MVWTFSILIPKETRTNVRQIQRTPVSLTDLSQAIAFASLLADDSEAVEYFSKALQEVIVNKKFYMELGLIPHRLRVYVWARDPQQIVNTAAIAEQTLRRRIENSIAR